MKKRYIIYFVLLIILDQLVKFLMLEKNITIIPYFLDFTYTKNLGGAFSIGNINSITILSLLLISFIIIYLVKYKDKIKSFIPYIFILSGSISNLIDRLFRGYVIDFIKVNILDFPCFNLADILIFLGVMFILLSYIYKIVKKNREEENKK